MSEGDAQGRTQEQSRHMRHFPKIAAQPQTIFNSRTFHSRRVNFNVHLAGTEAAGSHLGSGTPLAQPYWGPFKPPL